MRKRIEGSSLTIKEKDCCHTTSDKSDSFLVICHGVC